MRNRTMLVLGAVLLVLSAPTMLSALNVPQRMNYQAVLTSSGVAVTTPVSVVFRIYDVASGGTALWEETRSVAPDDAGRINVQLGTNTPLDESIFTGADRWLALEVQSDGEISPRTALASAGYSFKVSTVDGAKGGELTGDVVIKSAAAAANSMDYSLADATLTLQSLSGHRVVIGPADQVVLRALDDLDNEQLAATIDPINGATLAIRDPGGSYSQHMSTASSYYGETAAKETMAISKTLEVGKNGAYLFGETDLDTLVEIASISSGVPQITLTDRSVMKDVNAAAGRRTVIGGATLEKGIILSVTDASGSRIMETTVDNLTGDAEMTFFDVDAAKAASTKKMTFSKNGVVFYGATDLDTSMMLFSNGDIFGRGNVVMGQNFTATEKAALGTQTYGAWSTALGFNNAALGDSSTTSGGYANQTYSFGSTIAGGSHNVAGSASKSVYSYGESIGGGGNNTCVGRYSHIGGGVDNTVFADYAAIGAGYAVTINGTGSFIGGGLSNVAGISGVDEGYQAIGGGTNNRAYGSYATVAGGNSNVAATTGSTIAGGSENYASDGSAVAGGFGNRADGARCFVGAGANNRATSTSGFTVVCGGSQDTALASYSFIGGGSHNVIADVGQGSVIAGGTNNSIDYGACVIAGGENNSASQYGVIGGGSTNTAVGSFSVVAGGVYNKARGSYATISGGGGGSDIDSNTAYGQYSVVPGGRQNYANGTCSMASGQRAKAIHDGEYVWADYQSQNFPSANDEGGGNVNWIPLGGQPAGNQFIVRATNGVAFVSGIDGTSGDVTSGVALPSGSGAWSAMSDRESKENIEPVDPEDILRKIDQLEVSTWNYQTQSDEVRHMGPMAQDLYELFGLGESDRHISTIDADGVALAAIKALNEKTKRIDELEARVTELQRLLEKVLAERR